MQYTKTFTWLMPVVLITLFTKPCFAKTTKENTCSDGSFVEARSNKADEDKIKYSNIADDSRLTTVAGEKTVKEYNFSGKKETGLLFMVNSMNKTAENGSMYVTFIDMATSKLLFTERVTGKANNPVAAAMRAKKIP